MRAARGAAPASAYSCRRLRGAVLGRLGKPPPPRPPLQLTCPAAGQGTPTSASRPPGRSARRSRFTGVHQRAVRERRILWGALRQRGGDRTRDLHELHITGRSPSQAADRPSAASSPWLPIGPVQSVWASGRRFRMRCRRCSDIHARFQQLARARWRVVRGVTHRDDKRMLEPRQHFGQLGRRGRHGLLVRAASRGGSGRPRGAAAAVALACRRWRLNRRRRARVAAPWPCAPRLAPLGCSPGRWRMAWHVQPTQREQAPRRHPVALPVVAPQRPANTLQARPRAVSRRTAVPQSSRATAATCHWHLAEALLTEVAIVTSSRSLFPGSRAGWALAPVGAPEDGYMHPAPELRLCGRSAASKGWCHCTPMQGGQLRGTTQLAYFIVDALAGSYNQAAPGRSAALSLVTRREERDHDRLMCGLGRSLLNSVVRLLFLHKPVQI